VPEWSGSSIRYRSRFTSTQPNLPVHVLGEAATLDGDPVLPGFNLPLPQLFVKV
jgi:hypothetical protein